MGLSFHYSGRLRQPQQEQTLAAEVADICRDLSWEYTPLERRSEAAPLYGIAVSPPNCEALFLTFLPGGRLLSPVQFMIQGDPQDPYYYTIHTKTQYAGVDTHLALIKLLKYLGAKYFTELEVEDEGQYWETGDETLLRSQFHKYNQVLEALTDALSELPALPDESVESLAGRLERLLKEKFGGQQ
jgi:hypothetical protein